ncbi:WD40-repeat-containing domain protein [Entophlyctis helioformis]|nr:WD40-repeat-containing domain protein [Entophlyctis helioformis]
MTVFLREDAAFLKTPPRKHPQRTTIQHWQLRDLVACPTSRKEVFYVNQNAVYSLNTETQEATPALRDLSFSPTSMTTGCGYLAAGGQRSQVMIRQLSSTWHAQTTVGGSINNAMNISSHAGNTRLLICNNDQTIKVYSLPGLQRITSITLPTAVNYASVSPDGRKMIAVGDTPDVFLYNISPSGSYERVATMSASTDAGFSCSWNQSSEKFAVASQDGFVSVWDIRSSNKLVQLGSKQAGGDANPQVKGACRCVKFSTSGSIDLLMYSEHVSYVNVVDARSFNERQSIRVSPPGTDQHISGIAFSPDSKSVFIGSESCLLELEVDTMTRRCFPEGSIN